MSESFEKAFISDRAGISVVDFLADELPLSKVKIKEAMAKGAVWRKREGSDPERIRKAKEPVKLDDEIHIYYDNALLAFVTPKLQPVLDEDHYSLWVKPENILDQVSLYSDHLSLEKVLDISLPPELDCHWIYPNSQAMTGLVLLTHSRNIAAKFEALELEDSIDLTVSVTRPAKEPELCEHDEFLWEHCNHELTQTTGFEIRYVFEHAQGKELDILEAFELRATSQLDENPVQLCAEKLSFVCPISKLNKTIDLP